VLLKLLPRRKEVNVVDRGNYLTVHSGGQVYLYDPQPEDILLDDIAHALGAIYRWGGHTNPLWSVAQHSLLGSIYIPEKCYALEFLFHDAAEAYIGDVIRPLKRLPEIYEQYSTLEAKFERVIADKFNLQYPWPKAIKLFDDICGYTEACTIMRGSEPGYLISNKVYHREMAKRMIYCEPWQAADEFHDRARELAR
jgi:hypothetical protein